MNGRIADSLLHRFLLRAVGQLVEQACELQCCRVRCASKILGRWHGVAGLREKHSSGPHEGGAAGGFVGRSRRPVCPVTASMCNRWALMLPQWIDLRAGGCQFLGAGERGPVLCPAWASSATWTQGTRINWRSNLDAATGTVAKE